MNNKTYIGPFIVVDAIYGEKKESVFMCEDGHLINDNVYPKHYCNHCGAKVKLRDRVLKDVRLTYDENVSNFIKYYEKLEIDDTADDFHTLYEFDLSYEDEQFNNKIILVPHRTVNFIDSVIKLDQEKIDNNIRFFKNDYSEVISLLEKSFNNVEIKFGVLK